jgi:hypothetical protein
MKAIILSGALTLLLSCSGTRTTSIWLDLDGGNPSADYAWLARLLCGIQKDH